MPPWLDTLEAPPPLLPRGLFETNQLMSNCCGLKTISYEISIPLLVIYGQINELDPPPNENHKKGGKGPK